MFCKYCGNEIDDNAAFCSKCGNQIDSEKQNPIWQESANSQTLKSKKPIFKNKKLIVAIAFACVIGAGIPTGIYVRNKIKEKTVQSYSAEKLILIKEKNELYHIAVDKREENFTRENCEAVCAAGLDFVECYLDYYDGLVKINGKGDYTNMNDYINRLIETIENLINAHADYCSYDAQKNFYKRLVTIKGTWFYIRQN